MVATKIKKTFFIRYPTFIKILSSTFFIIATYFFSTSIFSTKTHWTTQEKTKIQSILSQLNIDEEKHLRAFIKDTFLLSEMPYTIFGTKPLSSTPIPNYPHFNEACEILIKISNQLKNKNIVFRIEKGKHNSYLFAINFTEVSKVYRKYQETFEQEGFTYEKLKEALLNRNVKIEHITHNQLLLGILFGYGLNNTKLFCRNQYLPDDQKIKLYPFNTGHPLFYYYFSPILPLYFACDPTTDETQSLRIQYQNDRMIIKKLYKEHDLFELMILQLSK